MLCWSSDNKKKKLLLVVYVYTKREKASPLSCGADQMGSMVDFCLVGKGIIVGVELLLVRVRVRK
jgi:hypothetical protein